MGNLTGKEVAQMHKDYVMQSWSKSGVDALPVEKAKGIYFWDYDGKKYADMASLLVCSNLGHELPEIVEAITSPQGIAGGLPARDAEYA